MFEFFHNNSFAGLPCTADSEAQRGNPFALRNPFPCRWAYPFPPSVDLLKNKKREILKEKRRKKVPLTPLKKRIFRRLCCRSRTSERLQVFGNVSLALAGCMHLVILLYAAHYSKKPFYPGRD